MEEEAEVIVGGSVHADQDYPPEEAPGFMGGLKSGLNAGVSFMNDAVANFGAAAAGTAAVAGGAAAQ